MKIIKYKKEKNDRYKLYLEDGSTVETYEDVILDNELLYKKNINDNLIDKIIKDNKYQKNYNACCKYISLRVRSTKEIKEYLKRKEVAEPEIERIIDTLTKRKILDDNIFAECYIKDKLNLTNWGEYKIKNSLQELGITNHIIEKYEYLFEKELQREKIKKIIRKSIKANHKNNNNIRNKIYTNLMNLGYSKDLIIEELNNNF
jgi:regulatory protein